MLQDTYERFSPWFNITAVCPCRKKRSCAWIQNLQYFPRLYGILSIHVFLNEYVYIKVEGFTPLAVLHDHGRKTRTQSPGSQSSSKRYIVDGKCQGLMFEFIFIDLTISLFISIILLNTRISQFVLKAHERKILLFPLLS